VFRWGGRARIKSVSWTTSRETAEVFARGYRGARVRKPVIATGLMPKPGVFGAYVDRKENEILLNPLWLRDDVSHVPYKAPDSKR